MDSNPTNAHALMYMFVSKLASLNVVQLYSYNFTFRYRLRGESIAKEYKEFWRILLNAELLSCYGFY